MDHGTPTIAPAQSGTEQRDIEKSFGVSYEPAHPSTSDLHEEDDTPLTRSEKIKATVDRLWIIEGVALFVCICALLGIFGLLKAYDGKPLPEWKRSGKVSVKNFVRSYEVSITLNAVVSLLATVFKIALGVPVAASLGQLKWVWFAKGQKLADFQTFDSAKGVLGSLTLLWRLRGRRLACLAAVVTLGALVIDFAFQSMITLPVLPQNVGLTASVPTTQAYTAFTPVVNGAHQSGASIDQSMVAGIYTGLFDFNRSSLVTPSCPSGNCAWNNSTPDITTYASLGVCGQCRDSTSHLSKTCSTMNTFTKDITNPVTNEPYNITVPYCNYTLPNGLSMPGTPNGSFTYMTTSSEVQNNTQFTSFSNPFSILSTIRATWGYVYANGTVTDNAETVLTVDDNGNPLPNAPVGELYTNYLETATATECALYYCIQSLSSQVVNGSFSEDVKDVYFNDTAGDTSLIDTGVSVFAANFSLTAPSSWKLAQNAPKTFDVLGNAWYATYSQFATFWTGIASGVQYVASAGAPSFTTDVVKTIFEQDSAGVEKVVQSVAQAMTTNIRQSNGEFSRGVSYQMVPYVVVSWAWITLPASLVVIAFILLVSTIFSTIKNGTRLWKTSSLAAFYHPLTDRGRGRIGEASNKVHLDKISEDVSVRWTKTERGWRFIPTQDGENSRKAR